jgi:hypothetical protein
MYERLSKWTKSANQDRNVSFPAGSLVIFDKVLFVLY